MDGVNSKLKIMNIHNCQNYFSVLALSNQVLNLYGCSSVLTVMNSAQNGAATSHSQFRNAISTPNPTHFAVRQSARSTFVKFARFGTIIEFRAKCDASIAIRMNL